MAKTKISEWSTTPASNTDIDGINIAEGCAPSGINDAIRDLMAQVRSWQSGASGDPFNGPMNGTIGATTTYSGAFTTLSASGTTTLSGLTASTALALDASKNVVSVANTGSGSNVLATSPTLVTPALGTPSSATLTNATGLPISTGVSGLGTGVATALAVNVGSAGAPVVNGGALGTPSSGTVTNLTGTASININGTVGATTPTTGAFTTTTVSTSETLSYGTANGVTYLNGSKVLTSGSALTFDGTSAQIGDSLSSADGSRFYVYANTPASTSYGIKIGGNANSYTQQAIRFYDTYFGAYAGFLGFTTNSLTFGQGTTEGMRLTSTGLGIGTSSPATKLHVGGNQILQNTSSAIANNWIRWQNSSGTYQAGIASYFNVADTGNIEFLNGSTTNMMLSSAGNLGLGVTPSAWNSSQWSVFEGAYGGALAFYKASNVPVTVLTSNAYYDTSWKYKTTDPALQYEMDGNVGIHKWYNAPSGTAGDAISFTQAMTLDASGNLFVNGTTQIAGSKLNVRGEGSYIGVGGSTVQLLIGDNGTTDGFLGTFTNHALTIRTNNTERARITSGGYFKASDNGNYQSSTSSSHEFSSTAADNLIKFRNTNANPYGADIYYSGAAPNGTGNTFLYCQDNAAVRATIRSNGGIANYQANDVNLSDRREKTNFAPAGEYLSKICAIPVQTFNYIDQNLEDDSGLTLGVVAQDVQAVAPELVTESNWGTQEEPKMRLSIYQTDLQYALMKAIQELKAEFDAYKASHP